VEIRHKAIAAAAASGAAALVLRLFPPSVYAFYPACPLRSLTGWYCPGCGMTHALAALLGGRFAEAMHHNPLAALLLPLVAGVAAIQLYSALCWNRWRPIAIPPRATAVLLTVTTLFGLLRNVL